MSSGSSSSTTVNKRGYSKNDVGTFNKYGLSLASNRGNKHNIADFKPAEKTQQTTETTTKNVFGGGNRSKGVVSTSGLSTSSFSDVTKEQLELLTNLFIARQKDVKSRRAAPGRRQTVLTR